MKLVREGDTRGLFQDRQVVSFLTGEPEYLDPLKEEAPLERLRSLTADLQQVFHSLSASGAPGGGGGYGPPGTGAGAGGEGRAPADDDDVIDAEFTAS